MPVYYDKRGRPVDTSFLRLLFDYHHQTPRTVRSPAPEVKTIEVRKPSVAATRPPAQGQVAPQPPQPPPPPPPPPAAAAAAATPATKPAPASPPPATAADAKASDAAPTTTTWTETQDAILLGLKWQGKEWKAISASMADKPVMELKARYKELQSSNGALKAEGGKKDAAAANKGGKGKGGGEDGGDDDAARSVVLEGNNHLTPSELLYVVEQAHKLEKRMWLQLASKLFDKTGKRMAPDFLKESLRGVVGR